MIFALKEVKSQILDDYDIDKVYSIWYYELFSCLKKRMDTLDILGIFIDCFYF